MQNTLGATGLLSAHDLRYGNKVYVPRSLEEFKRILEIFIDYEHDPISVNPWERLREMFAWREEKIIIFPYSEENIGPACYDVTVGELAYSTARGEVIYIEKDSPLEILPGETVLILTREFVALPPDVGAILQMRVSLVFEGLATTTGKIDPTWYGRLLVALTNASSRKIELYKDEKFATLLFFKCTPVPKEYWFGSRTSKSSLTTIRPSEVLSTLGLIFVDDAELRYIAFKTAFSTTKLREEGFRARLINRLALCLTELSDLRAEPFEIKSFLEDLDKKLAIPDNLKPEDLSQSWHRFVPIVYFHLLIEELSNLRRRKNIIRTVITINNDKRRIHNTHTVKTIQGPALQTCKSGQRV